MPRAAAKRAKTGRASGAAKIKAHYSDRRRMERAGDRTFDGFVRAMPPPLRPLALELVGVVDGAVPGLTRELKWGWPAFTIPGQKGMGSVLCSLATVGDRYVNLMFFQGARLADPKGRLEGSGKGMRHIKVHGPADIDAAYFRKLAKQARALVR